MPGGRSQVASEQVVERAELVGECAQAAAVLAHVEAHARLGPVADAAAEVRRVRVEDDDAVPTHEARHVRHVVDGVEPEPEPTDLRHATLLSPTISYNIYSIPELL